MLDLQQLSFKKYYQDNKDTALIRGRKQSIYNHIKVYLALELLWTIRNRAYHWGNLLKTKPNNRPYITTYFESDDVDKIIASIEPNKIVLFLDDLIKSIGNKELENLISLAELPKRWASVSP